MEDEKDDQKEEYTPPRILSSYPTGDKRSKKRRGMVKRKRGRGGGREVEEEVGET